MPQYKSLALTAAAAALLTIAACAPSGQTNAADPAATEQASSGETAMVSSNIVETAAASEDFSTLVVAVQAAGLVDTLSSPGPFTVFAPTNAAFDKLPAGTVASLTQPANQASLSRILTYHVVSGRVTAADLISQITAGGGRASIVTVEGAALTASLVGGNVVITDTAGGAATVTTADLSQSNGVIHVIDTVLIPPAS